jgi:ATP-dependent RNA helicase DeaD
MNLENIKLSEKTKKNLLKVGYNKLTSIQEKAIPLILQGKDVVGQSCTGTGKSAGFIIPVLEKLQSGTFPQVVILVPTRELALQVSEEARKLSQHTKLITLSIYGGVPIQKQLNVFWRGADIVVGTPGRIIDHLGRKSFQTNHLKFVIIDEVDKMIEKGFLEDIEKIIKKTPSSRQTLLFSATITPQVKIFSQHYLKSPEYIIGETENLERNNIQQYYIETPFSKKTQVLVDFLCLHRTKSTIIFTSTKRQAEKLNETLRKEGLFSDYLHSDLSQNRRIKVLGEFKDKKIALLVATDIAARGLDVKNISYVINYDLPQNTEFYVHRIGRTGRAGSSGKAVSFISSTKEKIQLRKISQEKKYKIEPLTLQKK